MAIKIEKTGKSGWLTYRAVDENGREGFGKTPLHAEVSLEKELKIKQVVENGWTSRYYSDGSLMSVVPPKE